MCKYLTEYNDIKNLVDLYFDFVPIKRIVKEFSEPLCYNFSTTEVIGVSISGYFDKEEPEYYGEKRAQFCGTLRDDNHDSCGTISFEEFVEQLRNHTNEYIKVHPEDKKELEDNLSKIEERLLG